MASYGRQRTDRSSARFTEQLEHVKQNFAGEYCLHDVISYSFLVLHEQLSEFKRPRNYEERVARVKKLISDVEESLTLLKPSAVTANDSQSQLERCEVSQAYLINDSNCIHCQELERTMHDLPSEVAALVNTGERLLAEGTLDSRSETAQVL